MNDSLFPDLFAAFEPAPPSERAERAVDRLRERFGPYCVRRCTMLEDERLTGFNPKDDHTIHPVSFFR